VRAIPPLDSFGNRIVILGTTNSGKSTLADALARKLGVPAIHLDRFRHLPNTNWKPRNDAEFHALHDAAIEQPGWTMDGNYSVLLPQRFARATGVIVIDDHFLRRYVRYFNRTLFQANRIGDLEGNRDSIKWNMVHWLWTTRNSAPRYREFAEQSGLPMVSCRSLQELNALYLAWNLEQPR